MRHKSFWYLWPESSRIYRDSSIHVQTIKAYRTCTPGLIVHRRINYRDWNLTHEGMGLAVLTGTTKKQCYWVAGVLGAICNWQWDESQHKEQIAASQRALEQAGMYEWLKSLR